ncbi:hypothetical protein [Gordonia oryzae]|nr:hypothetical protein [Gordonia oryzae]
MSVPKAVVFETAGLGAGIATGALVGAAVGGPVGALVGAGLGIVALTATTSAIQWLWK